MFGLVDVVLTLASAASSTSVASYDPVGPFQAAGNVALILICVSVGVLAVTSYIRQRPNMTYVVLVGYLVSCIIAVAETAQVAIFAYLLALVFGIYGYGQEMRKSAAGS